MPSYTHPFRIAQPATLAEASRLVLDGGPDAALYAGGSELLLAMKQGDSSVGRAAPGGILLANSRDRTSPLAPLLRGEG